MGDLISNKCSSEMDTSAAQNKAWGTLIASETRKRKMELDSKNLKYDTLEQTVERLTGELSELTGKYHHDKKRWAETLSDLERKIKIMKEEQAKLSKEARACADSIPDLDKMTEAVQALVEKDEELKSKYNKEMARSRRLLKFIK